MEQKSGYPVAETDVSPRLEHFRMVFDKSPFAVIVLGKREDGMWSAVYRNRSVGQYISEDSDLFADTEDRQILWEREEFTERICQEQGKSVHRSYYDEKKQRYIDMEGYLQDELIVCMFTDITEKVMTDKRKAEQKLEEKKEEGERIASLIDRIEVGVLILECQRDKIYVLMENEKVREMLGGSLCDGSRLDKGLLKESVVREDWGILVSAWAQLMQGEKRIEWILRCVNRENQWQQWLLFQANTIHQEDGSLQVVVSATDVSRQKRIEQKMIESQQNLNVAIAHSKIHYWNYDLTNHCIYMNENTSRELRMDQRLNNYPESWFARKMVHADDIALFKEQIRKVQSGARHVRFQARILNVRTKHYEWKNIKFTTFMDAEGNPSYAVATAENAVAYKRLEEYMSQVMSQNGLWSWELNMAENTLECIHNFGEENMFGIKGQIICNIPDGLWEQHIIYEEDWEKCRDMLERLYAGQERVKVQCRTWSSKVKDYVWYEYSFSIIEWENQKPVRAIGTSRDISAQKRMEQLYYEEQKILLGRDESLMASSRVNLSRHKVESMGTKEKKFSLQEVSDMMDFRERVSNYFDDVQISDEDNYALSVDRLFNKYKAGVQEVERYFIARRKGSPQHLCIKLSCKMLERPESGDIIAFFYSRNDTSNYTSNLTMNALLKRDYEMTGIIFTTTKQFRVLYGKRALKSNIQLTIDYDTELKKYYYVMGQKDADWLLDQISFDKLYQTLQEKKMFTVEFDMKEDGMIRRKQLRFIYIDQGLQLILVTRSDINDVIESERKKQRQLEDALNMAEKANNAKSEFLATVSHEIRTPMNVIIGMTQLAKEEKNNPKVVLEYIDEIALSSKHLLNLVNNVLDMSKIESGEFSLHPQRYSFEEFKKSVETLFIPLCSQKQIQFKIVDEVSYSAIYIDKMRLNQVIFNLLTNAVKYTDIGGKIRLFCKAKKQGKNLLLEFRVKDSGIGMSREFQEHMFKPFTQENNQVVASTQGTGLGLSIAKGIVDKMNGTLSVESEIGKGTEFVIQITAPIAAEYEISPEAEDVVQTIDFTGKKILVVEDHDLNQMIITKLLRKKNADVMIANNGKIAVERFQKSEPDEIDAILMDVRMPVMDGLQATRMIRNMERQDAKTVPIIAMTANAYDEDRQKSSEAGMDDHLAKPIDTKVLYETLYFYLKNEKGEEGQSNQNGGKQL